MCFLTNPMSHTMLRTFSSTCHIYATGQDTGYFYRTVQRRAHISLTRGTIQN